MKAIDALEVEVAPWAPALKLAWKLLPWGLLIAAVVAWRIACGTLHDVREADKLAAETTKREAAEQKAKWADDGKKAAETYAANLANRQPIILKSTDTVREYANTPEGQSLCLPAERVRGILETRQALQSAGPSFAGSGAVPAGGTSPARPD